MKHTMTKKRSGYIAEKAEKILAEFAKSEGLILTYDSGSYSDEKFTMRLSFACINEDGIPAEFAKKAVRMGLSPSDYGRVFTVNGRDFRLVGLKSRAPKFPLVAESCDASKQLFCFTRKSLPTDDNIDQPRNDAASIAEAMDVLRSENGWVSK